MGDGEQGINGTLELGVGEEVEIVVAREPEDVAANDLNGGTLLEDYQIRVRPLIDLVDKLRHIGLDKDVSLPSIVVVGDQSTGKSSVLEAISGVQLPRGTGIVTRCPLELRMKKTSIGGWAGRISFDVEHTTVDVWDDSSHKVLTDPGEIEEAVRQAQDALAGRGKGISKELISLEISSPNLPDLTLIDLPGIVRVAMNGQPADTPQKIRNLINKYISNEKTIILAVVPATADIETSDALAMAREKDEHHQRTIGVITKTDLVDRGAEGELMAVLLNERYPLEKGYIAVKCRGQQAIQNRQTLAAALAEEDAFFEAQEHFQELPSSQYGIRSLSLKLTEELVSQVEHVLPDLKTEIMEKQERTREELEKLGEGIPQERGDKTRFLMKLLTGYCDLLKQLADGHEEKIDVKHRLYNVNRVLFQEYATTIKDRWKAKIGPSSYGRNARVLFRQKVERAMDEDRGHELPRFIKFDTFKQLVIEILREFQGPADQCLTHVTHGVKQRLLQLAEEEFQRFPRLVDKTKFVITNVVEEFNKRAEGALQDLLDMEKLVFSQDSKYNGTLDKIIEDKLKEQGATTKQESVINGVGHLNTQYNKEKDVDTMFVLITAFMDISVARLADTIPMAVLQHMIIRVVQELRTRIGEFVLPESGALDTLTEKRELVNKRENLRAKRRRLTEATIELQNFSLA